VETAIGRRRPAAEGRPKPALVLAGLGVMLLGAGVLSLQVGASGVSALALLTGDELSARDRLILWDIRLPRLLLGALVGAALAVAGAILQGLFRNPLADPGIVGISAGAGLGAVIAILLGGAVPAVLAPLAGPLLVPAAAFAGGWITTFVLYRMSTRDGQTSIATLLLGGIGIAALAGAGIGIVVYVADDAQLRDITFWGLGSLAGATWGKLAVAGPVILAALLAAPLLARGLNALALGEAAAMHLGIPVERLKSGAILAAAGATGAAVAVSGGIGFVGIVAPHLIRLTAGPDHRTLLPAAALLGATLLVLGDLLARTVVAPAEVPIGIVTALVGAPVFLWLLLGRRGLGAL
jgi:iron complex transport system permease protein